MYEDDGPVALYSRLSLTAGLSGIEGQVGPVFTAALEPGALIYLGSDEPVGITVSGLVGVHGAPVQEDGALWLGVRLGSGMGGQEESGW